MWIRENSGSSVDMYLGLHISHTLTVADDDFGLKVIMNQAFKEFYVLL